MLYEIQRLDFPVTVRVLNALLSSFLLRRPAEKPWAAWQSFSTKSWKKTRWLPYPLCRSGFFKLSAGHSSELGLCLAVFSTEPDPDPDLQANFPAWLVNHLITVILPGGLWTPAPELCWPWLNDLFPASPHTSFTIMNMSNIFSEPCMLWTLHWSSLPFPYLPYLGTAGWDPSWRVPCPEGFVSAPGPQIPTPQGAAIPCGPWR